MGVLGSMSERTNRTIDGMIRRALEHIEVSAGRSTVYALVDGARDERIYPLLSAEGNEWRCLYGEGLPAPLARVAPCLVAMGSDRPFAGYFSRLGHGHDWGVLLRSTASIDELATHFAGLTRVLMLDGSEVLFRFYDPRVLRVFLPACDEKELGQVFGPVKAFLMEQEDGGWLVFRREGTGVVTKEPRWDRWID